MTQDSHLPPPIQGQELAYIIKTNTIHNRSQVFKTTEDAPQPS